MVDGSIADGVACFRCSRAMDEGMLMLMLVGRGGMKRMRWFGRGRYGTVGKHDW